MTKKNIWIGQFRLVIISLYFDKARHAINLNMPIDLPRINQFSGWYTIDLSRNYQLGDVQEGTSQEIEGVTYQWIKPEIGSKGNQKVYANTFRIKIKNNFLDRTCKC